METTSIIDEAALVRAARRGERAAFGELVRQYQRRAYAAAYSIVGNREDALDVAQDAFARAYKAIHRFDSAKPFYPWIHTIVRNLAFNVLRKRRRRGESSLDELVGSGFDPRDTGHDASAAAELDDVKQAIRRAMPGLSPDHREILQLRHFADLSYAEIAQSLNVPIGTVMSRLYAARKSLRERIEHERAEAVGA
jgi:RNA polymerase sigma-70 factor (ECF subfamily)